jgi:hypothetical protein
MLDWLDRLERRLAAGEDEELAVALVSLAAAAGQEIRIPDEERHAASRRALLLLATGGDPGRGLDLSGRAVTALAGDLERADRRALLMHGLRSLLDRTGALPHVHEALHALADEPEIAWRAYAASLLAEELGVD